jgi:hypothetical protein
MDTVQKHIYSNYHSPLSEPYRVYLVSIRSHRFTPAEEVPINSEQRFSEEEPPGDDLERMASRRNLLQFQELNVSYRTSSQLNCLQCRLEHQAWNSWSNGGPKRLVKNVL